MIDAMDSIASVKTLDRTGKGKNYIVAGGRQEVLDPNLHEHQVFSAITMLGGMGGATAVSIAADWCESHERSQWPNGIVSTFEYSIFYDTPGELPRSNTMYARGIGSSQPSHPENTAVPILDFLGQLISFLRVTPIIDFKPYNYFPSNLQYENYRPLSE